MCGIAVVIGDGTRCEVFDAMLRAVAPRGETTETHCDATLMAGTQRLHIVDRERAVQPWRSSDDRWLLCYNGEVYNHRELRDELRGLGHTMHSESDTEVVLEAFLEWGEEAVRHLRGEFAFAIVERPSGRVYLARDPVGVKPLYWSRRDDTMFVASEVKALVPVGAKVHEVPPGHHGFASPVDDPALEPYVDLLRLGEDEPRITDPGEAAALLCATFDESVRMRVDTDLTVGVILSGGLDSTVTLLHVLRHHPDCVAFTIGSHGSDDIAYARRLTADLGIRHEVIEVRPRQIRSGEIRNAIRMSELNEYGDIINAVVSVPLFRRVHDLGIKVVLVGDGSDELFGGYDMYHDVAPAGRDRLFRYKLRNLSRTELQRVDRTSMSQAVEARVPFLDLSMVKLAMRMPLALKWHNAQEKWIVREAFRDILPDYIRARTKNPMSHSSGLHERARLYKPGFARMYRSFGYDLLDPMKRDFSVVFEECALDLDRTLAAIETRPDYTPLEHARDLAGAARWNVRPALRYLQPARARERVRLGSADTST